MAVRVGETDKESLVPKNWCFWTMVLEKTLEGHCKEIQPVHPKGNQSWIFIGRTDAEAEAPVPWQFDAKNWLFGKNDAGKDWKQKEKGTTEDEMGGWHYQLNGHESEHAPGVGDGQRILVYYSPWGHKELDRNEQLNWTEAAVTDHILLSYVLTKLPRRLSGKESVCQSRICKKIRFDPWVR